MEQEIMNAYIQKQNKLIGELINKNLMLDARLEVVTAKLTQGASEAIGNGGVIPRGMGEPSRPAYGALYVLAGCARNRSPRMSP